MRTSAMAKESSSGLTAVNMKEAGSKESNQELVPTHPTAVKRRRASGSTASARNGLTKDG